MPSKIFDDTLTNVFNLVNAGEFDQAELILANLKAAVREEKPKQELLAHIEKTDKRAKEDLDKRTKAITESTGHHVEKTTKEHDARWEITHWHVLELWSFYYDLTRRYNL